MTSIIHDNPLLSAEIGDFYRIHSKKGAWEFMFFTGNRKSTRRGSFSGILPSNFRISASAFRCSEQIRLIPVLRGGFSGNRLRVAL